MTKTTPKTKKVSKKVNTVPAIEVEDITDGNPAFYAAYLELAPVINDMIVRRGNDTDAKANVFLGLCAILSELSSMTDTPAATAAHYITTFIPLFDSLAGKPSSPDFESFRANLERNPNSN